MVRPLHLQLKWHSLPELSESEADDDEFRMFSVEQYQKFCLFTKPER
jgi:hypothetical protein